MFDSKNISNYKLQDLAMKYRYNPYNKKVVDAYYKALYIKASPYNGKMDDYDNRMAIKEQQEGKGFNNIKKFKETIDKDCFSSLILSGSTGTGKTYIADRIAIGTLLRDDNRLPVNRVNNVIKKFRGNYSNWEGFGKSLIVIDDIGRGNIASSDEKLEIEILKKIIHDANETKSKLIITTNLKPETLKREYMADKATKSRMQGDNHIQAIFTGYDLRSDKMQAEYKLNK